MTDAMAKLEPMPPNDVPRPHPEKIFPVSWDQFHRDSRALAWRLAGGRAFEAIVCITRGGLVPAAIVARELGIRLIETVCVSSYDHTTLRPGGRTSPTAVSATCYRPRRWAPTEIGRPSLSGRRSTYFVASR